MFEYLYVYVLRLSAVFTVTLLYKSILYSSLMNITFYLQLVMLVLLTGCLQLWKTWKTQGIFKFWKTQGKLREFQIYSGNFCKCDCWH